MMDPLSQMPVFLDFKPAQIALIKSVFEEFNCPEDTVIIKQGDQASHLYLLIKGDVAVQYKPYDGPMITLTRLHDGDAFGWSAVVGSTFYTSSIISESKIESLRIKGIDLHNLIQDHPETGKMIVDRLANIVSSRWKNAHEQVQSLLNFDPSI